VLNACLAIVGLGVTLTFGSPLVKADTAVVQGTAQLDGKRVAQEAVVYLEGDKKSSPMAKAVVDQRNKTFIPHVSVVTVGTAVQFPNNDKVFHNVFAYFHAKKFDLGMYPRGATKTVSFDRKGLVALLCNVHSEMSAYIMVVDTPYFAVTDKQGKFSIKDVPAGTYKLQVWHESGAVLSQTLVVKPDGPGLSLNLKRK
jgi:plastocyanin